MPQKRWHHSHSNRKWLHSLKSHFHRAIPHKNHHFSLFWCILCTVTPDTLSSSKNINNMARVSFLLRFLWLCILLHLSYLLRAWKVHFSNLRMKTVCNIDIRRQRKIEILMLMIMKTNSRGYEVIMKSIGSSSRK